MATFTFLFRTDAGRIDRPTWWRGTMLLVGLLLLLTLGWTALAPWARRGLDERILVELASVAAHVYLFVYAFVILLVAVSFYNLSAKRWRDRGRPAALAGALPLALLFAGAADWLVARPQDLMPIWIATALHVLALAVAIWTAVELGCLAGRSEKWP